MNRSHHNDKFRWRRRVRVGILLLASVTQTSRVDAVDDHLHIPGGAASHAAAPADTLSARSTSQKQLRRGNPHNSRPVSRSVDVQQPPSAMALEEPISRDMIRSQIQGDHRQSEKAQRYEELRRLVGNVLQRGRPTETPGDSESAPQEDVQSTRDSETTTSQPESTPSPPTPDLSTGDSPSDVPVPDPLPNMAENSEEGPEANIPNVAISDLPAQLPLPDIVHGTIDRIGLADNLFALNENSIALEMYSQVDLSVLASTDRVWVEYQIACCYRRLDKIPEAQELYRRLVAQQDDEWISRLARWWLDRIGDKQRARDELAQAQKILTTLQEYGNDSTSP